MVDVSVELAGIKLRNPTILASGILGVSSSQLIRVFEAGAGGVVTKSFTKEYREGYKTPIIVAVKCGYLNAVGLANPGKQYIKDIVGPLKKKGIPVFVSIAGSSVEEFCELGIEAEESNADAVELNLSCPHAEKRGIEIGRDPDLVARIVEELKETIKLPVFVKLGLSDNLVNVMKQAEESGADGLVLINTVKGMAIDVWAKKPILSNKFGGLSGPAIHPIAVRVIYEAYENVEIPIIGVGGVDDWESAVEMILAGAKAVQIGSAIAYRGLEVFREIIEGIKNYLKENRYSKIDDIVGLAHE